MYPDWVILDAIIDLRGSQGGSVDWNITSAKINVKGNGEVPRPQIPSMKLIHQQLTFVSELERIV